MKSFILGLLWRIAIGFGISAIGIFISLIKHDWNLDNWFGGLGLVMIILAALPFMGGESASRGVAWYKPEYYQQDYRETEKRFDGAMNWSITMLLIGVINIAVPFLLYLIRH